MDKNNITVLAQFYYVAPKYAEVRLYRLVRDGVTARFERHAFIGPDPMHFGWERITSGVEQFEATDALLEQIGCGNIEVTQVPDE